MINKLLVLSYIMFGLVTIGLSTTVYAQFNNPLAEACNQGTASQSAVCQEAQNQGTTNPITGDGGIANTIARILSILVGIAGVIMLILGGLAFVTSGGNSEQESRARKRVIYGIVGIAVAAMAWTIITFVLERLL